MGEGQRQLGLAERAEPVTEAGVLEGLRARVPATMLVAVAVVEARQRSTTLIRRSYSLRQVVAAPAEAQAIKLIGLAAVAPRRDLPAHGKAKAVATAEPEEEEGEAAAAATTKQTS